MLMLDRLHLSCMLAHQLLLLVNVLAGRSLLLLHALALEVLKLRAVPGLQ